MVTWYHGKQHGRITKMCVQWCRSTEAILMHACKLDNII